MSKVDNAFKDPSTPTPSKRQKQTLTVSPFPVTPTVKAMTSTPGPLSYPLQTANVSRIDPPSSDSDRVHGYVKLSMYIFIVAF